MNIDQEMQQAMGTSADALNPQTPVDPVSGNAVPVGSEPKNVRDDIPAKLSEGEFIIPADVAKFYGMDKLYKMIDKAREQMAEMGPQVGDKVDDDTLPFPEEELQMAEGGAVPTRAYRAYAVDPNPNQNIGHVETQMGAGAGVDVKIFKDNTGFIRVVPFVNGKPIGEVPEGAVEQGSSSDAPKITDTENKIAANGSNDGGNSEWDRLNPDKQSYDVREISDEQLQTYYNQQKQYVDFLSTPAGWATKLAAGTLVPGVGQALTSGLVQDRFILGGLENEMQKRGLMPSSGGVESQGNLKYRDSSGNITPQTSRAIDRGAAANYRNDRNDDNPNTNFGGSASNSGAGKPVETGGSGSHPSYEKTFGISGRNNPGDRSRPSESNYGGDWGGNDDSFSSGGLW